VGSSKNNTRRSGRLHLETSCELVQVDPFEWFRDILSRIAMHSIQQLDELLPHRWSIA
jgi:hypothetical protein